MRRRYITHPEFQYTFTFSLVIGGVLTVFVPAMASIGALMAILKTANLDAMQDQILRSGMHQILSISWVLILIMSVILLFLGIYLSYKYVGPLLRLEQWVEKILLGENAAALQLRKGDELEKIKSSLDVLNARINKDGNK